MQTIPTFFRKNGWCYNLIERVGDVAIYRQDLRPTPDRSRPAAGYEVMIVRTRPERTVHYPGRTVTFPAGESLPGTEAWGKRAWTHHDLRGALAKAATLYQLAGKTSKTAPPAKQAAVLAA